MKTGEFFSGVYMEPVGYMDIDRCRLCGADVGGGNDAAKATHLEEHETKGDVERAGPGVGWRLCFGRQLHPVPEGIPAEEFHRGMERARRDVEMFNAALERLAEPLVDVIGDVRCACGVLARHGYTIRATGKVNCQRCTFKKAWALVRSPVPIPLAPEEPPASDMDSERHRAGASSSAPPPEGPWALFHDNERQRWVVAVAPGLLNNEPRRDCFASWYKAEAIAVRDTLNRVARPLETP